MRRRVWPGLMLALAGGCAETQPDRAEEYAADGLFLYQQHQYVHARQCFQEAARIHSADANLVYDIGQCYEHEGRTEKASEAYQQCLQLASNHADAHHALAAMLYFQGDKARATALVEQWLHDQPRLAAAYADDAWLLRQNGDLHGALDRLHQAYTLDPTDNRTLTEMALVYEALNRPDHAAQLYRRSLDLHPDQPEVKAHLASLEMSRLQKTEPPQ
jgi:Flp pilus assembly protein TadD